MLNNIIHLFVFIYSYQCHINKRKTLSRGGDVLQQTEQ